MRPRVNQIESEQGSILIEVLVSAIMLVITAVGVFSAFDAGTRASAEERHRAQAEGLAQADIARLRTMRISDLSNLLETKTVTVAGNEYTVESLAEYQTDKAGTASCKPGEASADYVEIRSEVTWPSIGSRDPVVEQSLVAPPNGSVSASKAARSRCRSKTPKTTAIEGVCPQRHRRRHVLRRDRRNRLRDLRRPARRQLHADPLRRPPGRQKRRTAGTAADQRGRESTNTLALQYDFGGTIEAEFETTVGGELVPSSADSVVAFNSGMRRRRSSARPARHRSSTATPLFPFAPPTRSTPGRARQTTHRANSRRKGRSAKRSSARRATTPVTIKLPPLNLTAWSGTEAEPGEAVEGADVKVTDTQVRRNGAGAHLHDQRGRELPDPGLPFSTYGVCVSGGVKHVNVSSLKVPADIEKPQEGATLDVFLGSAAALEREMPVSDERGYTLVELLVGTMVSLVVLAAILMMVQVATGDQNRVSEHVIANQRGRPAMNRIIDSCIPPASRRAWRRCAKGAPAAR